MVLDKPMGHVDFPVAIQAAVRVLSPELANEGAGVAEVDGPIAWPAVRDRETVDQVDSSVPAVVHYALGLHPAAVAQALEAYSGQGVQLLDILAAFLRAGLQVLSPVRSSMHGAAGSTTVKKNISPA